MKTTFKAIIGFIATMSFCSYGADLHGVKKITTKTSIDGKLTEAHWQEATELSLPFNINPGINSPANGKSLFIAFKADDPEPENIRAYFRDRDTIFQDDFVGIVIDTFNDNRRAYEFFVNPFGVQGDLIKDDTQGGNEDSNWDAIWYSAGKITETGYVVEMEIPFRALRFPAVEGKMDWGFQLLRVRPRDKRTVLSNSAMDRNLDCDICQYDKLTGLIATSSEQNIQLTPTLTYLGNQIRDEQSKDWNSLENKSDAGLDLRWGINDNVFLNATINPDFSQVEADAAQLDINNTYSLFVNEKRPFFLDGRDYFTTQRMNLLHTRNIASPEYGLKLTGKNDKHTYGLLAANDESTTVLIPNRQGSDIAELDEGSDILVGRYRMDIGKRSNIGAIVTNRESTGYKNTVTSVDGRTNFSKSDTISYQYAYSDTKNNLELQNQFDLNADQTDDAYSIRYNHNTQNYGYSANYMNYGDDFRADLGFESQTGVKKAILGGYYDWLQGSNKKWSRFGVFGDWDKTYDLHGTLLEEESEIYVNAEGPRQLYAEAGALKRKSFWNGTYYDIMSFSGFSRFDPWQNVRIWAFLRTGDQIDYSNDRLGDGINAEIGTNFKVGRHINGELNVNYRDLDVDSGTLFEAFQYDLRLNYQFNLFSYVRFIVQYTDIERNTELYNKPVDSMFRGMRTELLYAYKLNPQSLLYVGYTDRGKRDDSLGEFQKDNRKVFLKLSYAFQI